MYDEDVDIIYQVAGRSGEGVLEAASETGNFAIGVDSNQDDLFPGTIILSAMKRVDNAVYAFVESVVNDTYSPGETRVGLAEGSAGLSWDVGICSRTFDEFGPDDMVEQLPAVRQAIDEARAAILAGDIEVTNALEVSE
ncbi:MAG: BMP family ABC transporter substrate-binding protein [Chloroflexota bacterium]